MEKLAVELLLRPWELQVTLALPPLPIEPTVQQQLTGPLPPTIFAEPSKDRGCDPVE